MITVTINNNRGFISPGNRKDLNAIASIREELRIKNPNAYFLRRHMPKDWDGYQYYITEKGGFSAGMYPQIIALIESKDLEYTVIDDRLLTDFNEKLKLKLRGQEYRDYQNEALKAIIGNEVGGISFIRGIVKAATNAGKTMLMAGIYDITKVKSIILVNNTDLFNQMVFDDFPKLLKGRFGYMQGSKLVWGDVMVCMAQTLIKKIDDPSIRRRLGEYGAVLVDEGDLSDNKTYKKILSSLHTTFIRLAFSGSILVSDLAKYKMKNQNIKSFFGELLYDISNIELIKAGHSSEILIVINKGNTKFYDVDNYDDEYLRAIIKSRSRNQRIVSRIKYHMGEGRDKFLITVKLKKHVDYLYNILKEEFGDKYVIRYVEHTNRNRKKIIDDFKQGKTNILISSMIVKRGINFPLMQVMINAASGLSPENSLQLLGRATRKHESKKMTYYEDFYDEGRYVKRHSKRRIATYQNEGIPMLKLYKIK